MKSCSVTNTGTAGAVHSLWTVHRSYDEFGEKPDYQEADLGSNSMCFLSNTLSVLFEPV